MKWITRNRPKIDRLACPWLIRRFIDKDAEFIYVPQDSVIADAQRLGAIPYDIPGVEYTHYQDRCTFDYMVEKHNIQDKAVHTIAKIVRGADTDRHDLAPEAAGLWAISAGLGHNITNDYELLETAMVLYDALYSWATHLYTEKHLINSPFESMLHEVYHKLLKHEKGKTQPKWVKELREIIQDQADAQLVFNLKAISGALDINPSYLSREFSKYFDNMGFGEYVRRLRIEKAIQLMEDKTYTLTEIAYTSGFSDQSHFTRIFRQVMGASPSAYRKTMLKGKQDTKGK